jgi:ubiquinone/menaquinone biosynthesis C-methylase UbiE
MMFEPSDKARKTMARYDAKSVARYENDRKGKKKWGAEQDAFGSIIKGLADGASLLDCPCGTLRFREEYAGRPGVHVEAIDYSQDMIGEAKNHAEVLPNVIVRQGSIFSLDYADDTFDAAICCRFMNLIGTSDAQQAITELQRVTSRDVYFTNRVGHVRPGHFHSSRELCIIEKFMLPGWRVLSAKPMHERDYLLVHLHYGDAGE